ncbi:uncharacterized protein MONBRDRAFT_23652 [Monosiga brevicollis MX1]|uniref:Uncharacterized protein n=1 Tax=Monosiga brevicollis TaxID=81824 RepID=A9UU28_MONBE|nr:uncharacterized protein MONBRDRAFT_23652 [Monosiga brevicollis MX1]EDQ91351.1 predicted protein [Monosiga brevicollis MX1]|eukprot:XP_001743773.1 hypothetical protein [Monosiga brevicollis MX1]
MDQYYYNLKRQMDAMAAPNQFTQNACGCQCGGICQYVPGEFKKALEKSVDPAILLLVLGQAYVMTEAQRRERNQFAYMALGDPLGMISTEQHALGEPYALNFIDGTEVWTHQADPETALTEHGELWDKDKYPQIAPSISAYEAGEHIWAAEFTQEQYEKSMQEGALLGLSFLPWSTRVLAGSGNSKGRYFGRADYHWRNSGDLTYALAFNEWSGQLLTMKLQTMAILTAVSVGGYYGGKYLYNKYG